MGDFIDIQNPQNWPNDKVVRSIKKEFATLDEAFSYRFSSNILENSQAVYLIKLRVKEEITDRNMSELKNIKTTNFEENKVLLTIESTVNHYSLLCWKTETMRKFNCLKLLYQNSNKMNEFVVCNLESWVSRSHNGLPSDYEDNSDDINFVDLLLLTSIRGYNLLMLAAEAGNHEVVNELLGIGFSVNLRAADCTNAADLAWKCRHQNILLTLLKVDSKYPQGFDEEVASSPLHADLQNFIINVIKFFQNIENDETEDVQRFIEKNPQLRHIFNFENLSAPAVAIALKKFDIYKSLLERNVVMASNEDIKEITQGFNSEELQALKNIHDEFALENPDKHIKLLAAYSKISFDEANVRDRMRTIEDAFYELKESKHINPLLKSVAECRDLIIYFDFNREWVHFMDPCQNIGTNGATYLNGRIYIAAKDLLDPSKRNRALAVIAHELCHFSAQLLYKNFGKPYARNDIDNEMFFNDICFEYVQKENLDEVIKSVYRFYQPSLHHQEMIVRAPHLFAFYRDNPEALQTCRREYSRIFSYYIDVFLLKLKGSTATTEEVLGNQLKKQQEDEVDNKASTNLNEGSPINVMEIRNIGNRKDFQPNLKGMDDILLYAEVINRKVVVISVIGEHRKGKSFFMDYCLRFLHANYSSVSKMSKPTPISNWMGDGNEPLSGFSWKHGYAADTRGILFWPDVFLYDDPAGEKIAIILTDTQGLHEPNSTCEDNARIFSLSTLISSVQIVNVQGVIQENLIEHLEMATSLTKMISRKSGNRQEFSWKPFQKLLFLCRDWPDDRIGFNYEGGKNYLRTFLNVEEEPKTNAEIIRSKIRGSFDSIECFLLNHPGLVVQSSDFRGEWSKLIPVFVENLKELIESILKPENLTKKSILGKQVTAGEFRDFIVSYFEEFRSLEFPDHRNVFQVMIENQMKLIVNSQIKIYQDSINAEIDFNCECFESYIEEKHETAKAAAIDGFLKAEKFEDEKVVNKFLKMLKHEIEAVFKPWKEAMMRAFEALKQIKDFEAKIEELKHENLMKLNEYEQKIQENETELNECEEKLQEYQREKDDLLLENDMRRIEHENMLEIRIEELNLKIHEVEALREKEKQRKKELQNLQDELQKTRAQIETRQVSSWRDIRKILKKLLYFAIPLGIMILFRTPFSF